MSDQQKQIDINPLNEVQAMAEFVALQSSPVYRGKNLPKGNGMPVVVLPGLFANDLYLQTIHQWLKRLGYQPIRSNILWNVGCPKRLVQTTVEHVQSKLKDNPEKIAIIGHSRGGMLGKALAHYFSDRLHSLIVVGSPLGAMLALGKHGLEHFAGVSAENQQFANPNLVQLGRSFTQLLDPNCNSPLCSCEYIDQLFEPLPPSVNVVSIYSENDPIVPAPASMMAGAHNITVTGSHSGLMFNEEVYPYIAHALAN